MPSVRKKAASVKPPKTKSIPPKVINLFLCGLIFCLCLVWLPASPLWTIYPHPKIPSSNILSSGLYNYRHPAIPSLKSTTSPSLLTSSYILLDVDTNTVLLSKNSHLKTFPASITKLATALTALNLYPLDEIITITDPYKDGKVMDLKPGEKITVRSLVTGLLVYSANDAAYNLAKYHSRGITGFVDEMNLLMSRYQLKDTNFVNYDGIHQPNHYSTVYDLSQLARLAIKNPIITDVVKSTKLTVTDVEGKIAHPLLSTNELLEVVPEIEGLKTGWTPEAGGCFVGLININGHRLISVVTQSQDRFVDTRTLVTWAKENIVWMQYPVKI